MAEAHQGVAFQFSVTEDEGLHLSVSFEAFKAVFLSGVRSWRKRLGRLMVNYFFLIVFNFILIIVDNLKL
jgi:hypothetical protein